MKYLLTQRDTMSLTMMKGQSNLVIMLLITKKYKIQLDPPPAISHPPARSYPPAIHFHSYPAVSHSLSPSSCSLYLIFLLLPLTLSHLSPAVSHSPPAIFHPPHPAVSHPHPIISHPPAIITPLTYMYYPYPPSSNTYPPPSNTYTPYYIF